MRDEMENGPFHGEEGSQKREENPRRRKGSVKSVVNTALALVVIVGGVAACAAFYFTTVPKGQEKWYYFLSVVLLVVGFFVNRFLHALLHETGHLFFGLASGFKLCEFSVGPFRFTRTDKLRFRIKRNKYGGMVMMASKKHDKLYGRYFSLIFGGILLSILTGLGYLAFAFFARGAHFLLYSFFLPGFAASCHMIAMNVIPFETDGTFSDGAILEGIVKKDVPTRLNVVLMAIQGMLCAGKSPREIDRKYFYEVPEGAAGVNEVQLLDYRYIYELDCENYPEVVRLTEEIEKRYEILPEVFRRGILTDIFFTELWLKKNEDRARNLWVGIEKYIAHDLNVCNLRIRMACELYVKKNPRLALATGKTALQVKKEFIIPGVADMEERLIRKLASEAEEILSREQSQKVPDTLTEYKG